MKILACTSVLPKFHGRQGKKYTPQVHFPVGEGGNGVQDIAPPLQRNLGAKFSESSFHHFKIYFTQISRCYLYTTTQNDLFQ